MTQAIIYSPTKNAMQSGKAKLKFWVLEFSKTSAKQVDELMGWQGGSDMKQEIRLKFESKEEAVGYAERQNLDYIVKEPKKRKVTIQAYADNFTS